jgi:preprotein translocase subunit YajC
MIRPKVKQEREHRERIQALKKGDAVTTAGGIIGEVVHIKDQEVTVKTGDTRIIVLRDRITGVGGEAPENKTS